jgi:hypothetical protein
MTKEFGLNLKLKIPPPHRLLLQALESREADEGPFEILGFGGFYHKSIRIVIIRELFQLRREREVFEGESGVGDTICVRD